MYVVKLIALLGLFNTATSTYAALPTPTQHNPYTNVRRYHARDALSVTTALADIPSVNQLMDGKDIGHTPKSPHQPHKKRDLNSKSVDSPTLALLNITCDFTLAYSALLKCRTEGLHTYPNIQRLSITAEQAILVRADTGRLERMVLIHTLQVKQVKELERRPGARYLKSNGEDPVRMVMQVCREVAGWYVERTELWGNEEKRAWRSCGLVGG